MQGNNGTYLKETSGNWQAELEPKVKGAVIVPHDEGYDQARLGWNLSVDQRPAIIVAAEGRDDIIEAVRFARDKDLKVTVMARGHGTIRTADGCLLVVTSGMKDVRVDAERRSAWVEAGAKWGLVLERTQAAGLAPLLGSSPDVGAVAYTLGGGMGWLARKHGLASDSVNYFELVTADGETLRASIDENSDLFWGLRGGSGTFGIVTDMEIQLQPLTHVYGGNLLYDVSMAKEVFARFREWIASAPDELTSSFAIMNFPPFPELPEVLRGRSFAIARGCYCGNHEGGEELLRYWREWQAPVLDDFRWMPFIEAGSISNEPEDPVPGKSSGAWLSDIEDGVIDALVRHVAPANGPSPVLVSEIRHAGGAISKNVTGTSAYSHRDAQYLLQLVAMTPTPEIKAAAAQHMELIYQDLLPHLTGGVYMNFLEGAESQARIRDGFSAQAYKKLAALKARYDPGNVFAQGFNL